MDPILEVFRKEIETVDLNTISDESEFKIPVYDRYAHFNMEVLIILAITDAEFGFTIEQEDYKKLKTWGDFKALIRARRTK